jgi:hypothetical protein
MKEYIKNNRNENDIRFFQEEQIKINDESFESTELNEFNYSFEKEIDLENFLSKKMDGLYEVDHPLEDVDVNKNGGNIENKEIIENLDKNAEKEKNKNAKAPEEILVILRKALGDKTLRFINSPFKSLLKPKKFSLTGRILLNINYN